MEDTFPNLGYEVVLIVIGIFLSGLAASFIGRLRKRQDCLEKIAKNVEELNKRSYRIEKTIIILAKLQEDTISKTHPELKTEWEEIVKELLDTDYPSKI
jgi:type II secretory pathway pseudopilin PulG